MFCQKCGSNNNDGAAFCNDCGADLRLVPINPTSHKRDFGNDEEGFVIIKRLEDEKKGHVGPILLVLIGIALFFIGRFPLLFGLESDPVYSVIGKILMIVAVIWDVWRINKNRNLEKEIESLRAKSVEINLVASSSPSGKQTQFGNVELTSIRSVENFAPTNFTEIRTPFIATILSFFFVGWGQWYNGKTWDGVKLLGIFLGVYVLMIIFSTVLSTIQPLALFLTLILFFVLLMIWIYGMYDANKIAKMINRGEDAFSGKSQLFWLPAIILSIAVLVIFLAVVFAFIFGMAGGTSYS